MRVQLLSDLHLEFHRDGGGSFIRALDPDGVDVLVLAGDVGTADTVVAGLELICSRYREAEVLFVAGNHEFYGSCPTAVLEALRELESRTPNLSFLENRTVEIGDLCLAGTTLWFPDDPLNPVYAPALADFAVIRDFVPWVYEQNEAAKAFLRGAAPLADVVITHHIPTYQAVAPEWRGSELNRFFVCELGELIAAAQPPWWFFGHTHTPGRFEVGSTKLITNPLGYAFEPKATYRDRLVVDVQPRASGP